MCKACWQLTERGGNPWPAKGKAEGGRQKAEGGGEITASGAGNPQLKEEAKKMMKPRYDVPAMIAEYDKGNGPGAAELARKYHTQPTNIRKVLKAAGVFVYERRPMTGPAAKAAPAKRGRPAKAATAVVHVSGRAATEVPMESGREGAVPGALPAGQVKVDKGGLGMGWHYRALPAGQVKVTLRAATIHFEGASAALKDQLAEIAKFLGVPKAES